MHGREPTGEADSALGPSVDQVVKRSKMFPSELVSAR